ncbi:MAG: hypothetical protein ACRDU0_10380, partial [Mycobacterium sp.]
MDRFESSVAPPSARGRMWWTWQWAAGVSQPPGQAQSPPSRAVTARRMCGAIVSVVRHPRLGADHRRRP